MKLSTKMIFIFCSVLLLENVFSYDMQDLWKQKNFLFSTFTNLDQLGHNLTQAELIIFHMKTYSNIFHESTNRVLHEVYANLNGESDNHCLIIYENYANLRNLSLEQANECYETVFRKFNFNSANIQEVQNNFYLFKQNLNIVINEIEKNFRSSQAIILGLEGSDADSREAFLDASNFTLNLYLRESKNYEVLYRNSRQIIETVKEMMPELNKCEKVMFEQKEELFIEEVQKCIDVVKYW